MTRGLTAAETGNGHVPPGEATDKVHPFDWRSSRKPELDDYQPFLHVPNEAAREALWRVVTAIHEVSGDLWQPANCHRTGTLKMAADQLADQRELAGVEITPMAYGHDAHFFLSVQLPGTERGLVIDPFGVPNPDSPVEDQRRITPFFGDPELAPPNHRKAYAEAKPVPESHQGMTSSHFHP